MDPITMMLLAQGVAGLGKAGYGAYQKSRGKKALSSAFEAPTGTPSEYADLIKQARASELAQRRIDEINRSMATSTQALQQGGSRAVIGGIGAVTEAGSRSKTQALSQQQQEIIRALERATVGAERQRSRDVARQNREEGLAMQAIQAGQENIVGGISDVVEAGVSYGQAKSEGLIKGKKAKNSLKANEATTAVQKDLFKGAFDPAPKKSKSSLNKEEFKTLMEGVDSLTMEEFKNGGVKKTPGKFSHKKNPIDIVQKGNKIGEMTGGEYIFNPKQAKSLQKLSKSGNSDLHKFVRTLLNKPQFK